MPVLQHCPVMVTMTLPAGVMRAVHVFTPALQYRLKNGGHLPVMAVRTSKYDYRAMRLYHRVEILGPSSMEPLFHKPLPGTAGRGVAILFTKAELRCWYAEGRVPATIPTHDSTSIETLLEEVLRRYGA